MATRNRKYITNVLASLLVKLPPPPLTVKELANNKLAEDIYYSAHDHFETDLTVETEDPLVSTEKKLVLVQPSRSPGKSVSLF